MEDYSVDDEYVNIETEPKNKTTNLQIIAFTFSIFGFALSFAALILLISTAILFAEWRQKYKNQVLLNFMLSRLFYVAVRIIIDVSLLLEFYLQASFVRRHQMLVHVYSELALVAWMFVFTRTMYEDLITIINVPMSHRMLKTALCAWLIPLILSVLVVIVPYKQKHVTLYNYLIFLVVLKWPFLCYNGVLLAKILKSLQSKNRTLCHNRPENRTRIILTMIFLIFIFSAQQIVHDIYKFTFLVMHNNFDQRAYLLKHYVVLVNIVAIYYYPISIILWVICNAHTKKLWKNYINKKF